MNESKVWLPFKLFCIGSFFCLTALYSPLSWSRFSFTQQNQGWVASTNVQTSEGLGQILREMGVEPNWQNRSWIRDIVQANPGKLASNGQILYSNQNIDIPIESLKYCQGYETLKTEVAQNAPPAQPIAEPPVVTPPPTEAPPSESIVTESDEVTAPIEPEQSSLSYSMLFWGGAGFAMIVGEDSNANSTELSSEILGAFGADFFLHWKDFLDFRVFARGTYVSFSPPSNIVVNLEEQLVARFGGGLRYALMPSLWIGAFFESRQAHRADFNLTTLEVNTPQVLVAGMDFDIRVTTWSEKALYLGLAPHFLNEVDHNSISLDSGFGITTKLQLAPYKQVDASGMVYGLEYLFEQQDVSNSFGNISKQSNHNAFAYLGYKL